MTVSAQLDQLLLQRVITFTGLIFVTFVESALGQIPLFYGVVPKLLFGLLFMLTLHYPNVVPIVSVMLVGLVFDLSQGNPLGYSSSLYFIVVLYTKFRRGFLVQAEAMTIWLEFMAMVVALMLYMMAIFVFYTGAWPPFSGMILQIGLTILVFPIINWAFEFFRELAFYIGGRG